MNHLMIDLETMGTNPNAPIAGIGAVFFEPSTGRTGERFYARVDFAMAMTLGAVADGDTIKWWMAQSSESRAELIADFALPTSLALAQLNQFIAANQFPTGRKYLRVWGNGAAFDNVILRAAYARAGAEVPWDWWHDLDVRTVVEMGRVLGYDPKRNNAFTGTRHNALDDAVFQATYVSELWQRMTTQPEAE
ncbi:3'-5' exoribonuclease [Citrobacter freundii]|uniref:3'-5' exonuclease n=1 Tax=Citrobacter freundii TaxID=546 RepID=UPI00190055EF|nr:3'-5' exonuclease [Citrobacter freundii]MBJ8767870.1 3'-5' exoribonuclease [Citrobacter freundii]